MVLVYLSMAANHFNRVWKTGESLWGHSIAGNGSALAHHNYATSSKDLDVREKHFRKSMELAPWYPLARINYGLTLMSQGKKKEGLKHVEIGWKMGPQAGQNSFLTAMGYKMAGETKKAAALAAMSAHAIPIIRYQYEAAFLLIKANQPELAIPFLEQVRQKNPDFEFSGYLLAVAYEKTGRTEDAIAAYELYIPRHPQDFFARLNLAKLYLQQEDCPRAIEGLQQALSLNSQLPEAHQHLATCYKKMGNPEEAKKHLAIWKQHKTEFGTKTTAK